MSDIVKVSPKVYQASTLKAHTLGPGIFRIDCFHGVR
jgi:hypothetical protein